MFFRELSKQLQLFPKVSYAKVCCLRRYFRDRQDIKYKDGKTVSELMDERAKEFMENLDDELKETKKSLELMIERMRNENLRVPDEMNDRTWCELLQQRPTESAYIRYLEILYGKERAIEFKKQKRLEQSRLLEENEAMYDHLYHLSFERDRSILMWNKISAMMLGIPVVIDLDFPGLFQPQARRAADHILRALRSNALHPQPLSFNLTSCKNNVRLLDNERAGNSFPGAYFHEQHYLDIFPPDQLVYLSPDGPPLDRFDINSIYIIGGNVEHQTNETFAKAKEQGIRCASFPLFLHGRLIRTTRILSIYHSLDIVRSMYYWHSWKSAFRECFTPEQYSLEDPFIRKPKPRLVKKMNFWHKRNKLDSYNRREHQNIPRNKL